MTDQYQQPPVKDNNNNQGYIYNPYGELLKEQDYNPYKYTSNQVEPQHVYPIEQQQQNQVYIPQEGQYLLGDQINPDFLKYGSIEEKKQFLIKVVGIWLMQEVFQVLLCILALTDYNYDRSFYDYQYDSHRFIYYFFMIVWILSLVISRSIPPKQRRNRNCLTLLIVFTLSYGFFASGCVAGGNKSVKDINLSFIFGIFFFLIGIVNCMTLAGLLISFSLSKHLPTYSTSLKYLILAPIPAFFLMLLFENGTYLNVAAMFLMAECVAVTFGSFFIFSLMQILDGKYKLQQKQYLIGSLIIYANMFCPC